MLSSLAVPALALISTLSAGAPQDAQSILETARAKQVERWAGVQDYTVDQTMLGRRALVYFEKFNIGGDPGKPAFRMVPVTEISREWYEGMGYESPTSEQLMALADGWEMMGTAMAQAGVPAGGTPMGDPSELLGEMAGFLRGGIEFDEDGGRSAAAEAFAGMATFARYARLVGEERVGDREAFLLRADNLASVPEAQLEEGYTIEAASLWIDTRDYVPLRLKVEVTAQTDDGDQAMTIEKLDQDYRRVGSLYESFRQVLRISGLMDAMDPEQRREMQEAMQQLEELEEQLNQLPESQRRMIMSRMGPQLEQVRQMAAGGSIEVLVEVDKIVVNQGPPGPLDLGRAVVGAP
jgi:hypothetical protein